MVTLSPVWKENEISLIIPSLKTNKHDKFFIFSNWYNNQLRI